ncbi:uncharacterized protein LOC126574388 [Anopheles aquasalis]|uniref:uncharacterized protein LOC126574388 n=1 Tax=Anopheles aquasalis TaxID=42839 RepID=UPI00215AF47C|nr:uncharacterized protein LOC126574388 [Anopheles aquasalis]
MSTDSIHLESNDGDDEPIAQAPEALSLTTLLADDPTAAALQPLANRNDPTSAALSSSESVPTLEGNSDGRRRRRLGRKRKRRPLPDDYWAAEIGKPNEDFEPMPDGPAAVVAGGGGGGRISERKRLAYAGAASRWEGIGAGKPAATRTAHWMDNPYTDVAVDTTYQHGRRPPSSAGGGHFAPIESNRPRKIPPTIRPSEQQPSGQPNPKAYRKPYSQARRNEDDSSNETVGPRLPSASATASDLKALLKQSDGLSLSEILQQRNISLQDLIKGKQMALAALTQSPLELTTVRPSGDTEATTVTSPTLSSVRFQVKSETLSTTITSTLRPTTMTTMNDDIASSEPASSTTTTAPVHSEEENSVDDIFTTASGTTGGDAASVANDGDDGTGSIFPTVEIKQLALNPVLPFVKEERMRPIKGVASRIRPDLSNTHIRTEPARLGSKRFTAATTTTTTVDDAPATVSVTAATAAPVTSPGRERWTPSASIVERHREQLQQRAATQQQQHPVPIAKELIAPQRNSAESSSVLPEAEAMVELAPERHLLRRVPKLKPRIAIKPRLVNAVAATAAGVSQSTATSPATSTSRQPPATEQRDQFNLSDVELPDESGAQELGPTRETESSGNGVGVASPQGPTRQQRLHDDAEPELNIIEKFTSFAEPPPSSSASGGGAIAPSDLSTAEEDQAVADLIGRISEHTQRSFTDSLEDFYRDVTESNPSLFNDLAPIASSDDRRELLELMEDRRIGSRLAKVLSQRNMTLEQLLEHRRRGSSQLHLAEIVNGKVKPIDDKIDIVTAFEHFPRFNIGNLRSIRPDDIKLDSQGFSYFTSIINLRPSDDVYKEARAMGAGGGGGAGRHRSSPSANHRESHFLAKGGSKDRLLVPSRVSATTGTYEQPREEDGEQDMMMGDLLDLELSGHGFQHHRASSVTIESTSIPVGVRSAIVASSAIVGVSLAIFVTIYIVFRLRQRRHNKLNYTENFNMAKGRLPIIHNVNEGRSSAGSSRSNGSSIGEPQQQQQQQQQHQQQQIVYTTHRAMGHAGSSSSHGNVGKHSTMDPNSCEIQDYLWDRKPFQ